MASKKFVVRLDANEWTRLDDLISMGKASAIAILKARILLEADQGEAGQGEAGAGWSDGAIVKALDTNLTMVERTRAKLVEEGLDAAGCADLR